MSGSLPESLAQMVQFQKLAIPMLNAGLLVFARTASFFHFCPIFNRKDIPAQLKISIALLITVVLVPIVPMPTTPVPTGVMFMVMTGLNIFIGAFFGILLDIVLQVVISSGSILNNQIGLSAANTFDPSRRTQTALLEGFFVFLVAATFLQMNGLHWLIRFLVTSFELCALDVTRVNVFDYVNMAYIVSLTGDSLKVSIEVMASAFVGTLLLDVVLGVVNRTAQQIPVYQISGSVKPVVGLLILLATLPLFIDTVEHHITKHLKLYEPTTEITKTKTHATLPTHVQRVQQATQALATTVGH
jgi:flagellar biosynthesis protein FliR